MNDKPRPRKRITNKIRLLRFMASEMTQEELGRRIRMTRQTIAAIEQGKYSPSLEAAFRIADVFDKPLGEVFAWEADGEALLEPISLDQPS